QLEASSSNPTLLPPENVTFSTNTLPRVVATLRPAATQNGTTNLTIPVRRPVDRASASVVVPNNVIAVNDTPTLSRLITKTTEEDVPISFEIIATDVDSASSNIVVVASSSVQSVIANSNIVLTAT